MKEKLEKYINTLYNEIIGSKFPYCSVTMEMKDCKMRGI